MKTTQNILMITALLASAVAAQAIDFPPVLMPQDEFAGISSPTRNTYYIDGRVYTVWESPPYPRGPMKPEYNDSIRARINNITPGSRFVYPDEYFDPGVLAANQGKVLTQDDYEYVMSHFWDMPSDIVAGMFDGLYYDTANFTNQQIADYLNLVSLAVLMPEREEARLFGGLEANHILIFALTDNAFAYQVDSSLDPSALSPDRRLAIRQSVDWASVSFDFKTIEGAPGAQLKGQDFSGTNVSGTQLQAAAPDMDQVNFSGLNLAGLNTTFRTFRNANLSNSVVTLDQLKAVAGGGLTGVNLAGTGITRQMLSAPPNARPPAEVASIKFRHDD